MGTAMDKLREAVDASSQWSGCDWKTQHGRTGIDLDGVSAVSAGARAEELDDLASWMRDGGIVSLDDDAMDEYAESDVTSLRSARDELRSREDIEEGRPEVLAQVLAADWRSAAEWLAEVEGAARLAEENGRAALAAAERGEWKEALEKAECAAEQERHYGDAHCWGGLAALVSAATIESAERR